jgi:glycyl-tRNA synthetase
MKSLISFCQQKGFIYGPEPEIYGGLAGFYTYGPTGTLLKRRVEQVIRQTFQQAHFFEVECPTVLPAAVWEASGHLGGFTDPVIKDKDGNAHRADKLVEEHYAKHSIHEPVPSDFAKLLDAIKHHKITAPNGTELVHEIKKHNLMMQTTIGLDTEAYNRPETATATYLPFLRYYEFFRKQLPFGVFQIGKAYRNEISPRQYLLRCREFTQAEGQFFMHPLDKETFERFDAIKDTSLPFWHWHDQEKGHDVSYETVQDALHRKHISSQAYGWTIHLAYTLFRNMGIPAERIRLRQHAPDEKAFYAADAWDVEINMPSFGWTEVCGVHDRTNYDLTQHAKFSKTDLIAFDEQRREKYVPHVLEIAFGVDRPVFALLDMFYEEQAEGEGKTMLRVPYHLAPIQVAVLPLIKKLSVEGEELFQELSREFICTYDESGSIGRRYLRNAEVGTPFCVTIDFETRENQTVTVRDRDTEQQVRVKRSELPQALRSLLAGAPLTAFGTPLAAKE